MVFFPFQRGTFLSYLLQGAISLRKSWALREQGQFKQAEIVYNEALLLTVQQEDTFNQAVVFGQLGTFAFGQGRYTEAQSRYTSANEFFRAVGDRRNEAASWHQLGLIAEMQEQWREAERCYRESLALMDIIGDTTGAAGTYNQLARIAKATKRPTEAENLWRQALELSRPGSLEQAISYNNLAELLVQEIKADHTKMERLAEARDYAERALSIKKNFEASSEIWAAFEVLADIATLEGQAKAAEDHRRHERETFASSAGNREKVKLEHRVFILTASAAASGDRGAQTVAEQDLLELGIYTATAIRRIWAGERNWHSLAKYLDAKDALLILLILETIAQLVELHEKPLEDVIDSLPSTVIKAIEQGDPIAIKQAIDDLPPEEFLWVGEVLRYLEKWNRKRNKRRKLKG